MSRCPKLSLHAQTSSRRTAASAPNFAQRYFDLPETSSLFVRGDLDIALQSSYVLAAVRGHSGPLLGPYVSCVPRGRQDCDLLCALKHGNDVLDTGSRTTIRANLGTEIDT